MCIQEYKYLFLYVQLENMYTRCLYHVYTRIYQTKQVYTCYKQAKARYLLVLHAINNMNQGPCAYQRAALTIMPPAFMQFDKYLQ